MMWMRGSAAARRLRVSHSGWCPRGGKAFTHQPHVKEALRTDRDSLLERASTANGFLRASNELRSKANTNSRLSLERQKRLRETPFIPGLQNMSGSSITVAGMITRMGTTESTLPSSLMLIPAAHQPGLVAGSPIRRRKAVAVCIRARTIVIA